MSPVQTSPVAGVRTPSPAHLIQEFYFASPSQKTFSETEFIQLNFENLNPFEQLSDQYLDFGVRFSGAVTLEPSNPSFVPHSGTKVLMPMDNLTGITIEFSHPVEQAGVFVAGMKSVVLIALDANNHPITKVSTDADEPFDPSEYGTQALPYHQLQVKGKKIIKMVCFSSAPFILDDLFVEQSAVMCEVKVADCENLTAFKNVS
jgi:hypothetical protein